MLVLSRKTDDCVKFHIPPSDQPREITLTVVSIRGTTVRLGFEADQDVNILRNELQRRPEAQAPQHQHKDHQDK